MELRRMPPDPSANPVKRLVRLESEAAIKHAPAVSRAVTVLRLLASDQTGLGVNEIARRVNLVPSTCFHVLRALVDEDFVIFSPENKSYRLNTGLLTLTRNALDKAKFPNAVQPELERLAIEHDTTAVAMGLNHRGWMVILTKSSADRPISRYLKPGRQFPELIGATGRCVAAVSGLSREELRARFEVLHWERPPKFEDWYAEVVRTRKSGIGVDRGNFVEGVIAVATLLPNCPSCNVQGIALVGFCHDLSEKMLRTLKKSLIGARETVASRLS